MKEKKSFPIWNFIAFGRNKKSFASRWFFYLFVIKHWSRTVLSIVLWHDNHTDDIRLDYIICSVRMQVVTHFVDLCWVAVSTVALTSCCMKKSRFYRFHLNVDIIVISTSLYENKHRVWVMPVGKVSSLNFTQLEKPPTRCTSLTLIWFYTRPAVKYSTSYRHTCV